MMVSALSNIPCSRTRACTFSRTKSISSDSLTPVCKDLLRESIQDGRQIAECAMIRNIGNVCQECFSCTVCLKLPVQQVSGNIVRLKCLRHPAVRVCFPNWTEQPIFVHKVPYFFTFIRTGGSLWRRRI